LSQTIAFFCATVSCAHAGAFLEPTGEGQIITSVSFSDTTRAFDANGKLIPVPSYRKFELGTYIEYGATSWLTIVASPSFDRIQNAPSPGITKTTAGIGDTGVGARIGIYQTPDFAFSVQGIVRPPFGLQTDSANDFYTHSQVWTGELRGLFGYGTQVWGYNSFADLEMGYRWNDVGTPNEWRADLTLGIHATEKILVLAQDFAAISDGRSFSNPSYFWNKGQVSGVYAFSAVWSAQIGGFLTIAGRNAGREMGPIAAIWYRF
jgi:hypothetical protein